MKHLFSLLLTALMFSSQVNAAEITKTFSASEVSEEWVLSKYEGPEEIVAWANVEEKGLPINSSDVEYYPWITSVGQFGNVSKIEIEVYSEYSRMSVNEVKVGETSLTSESEYGYDSNPDKTFVFLADAYSEKPMGTISIGFNDISNKTLYLKTISITYNPDGIDRQLKWDVNTLDVNLGEDFQNPVLSGETTGVTFTSSNSDIASISSEGVLTPLSIGQTIITATCPELYPWRSGTCSYVVNVYFELTGSGTSESVNVTTPGTLKEVIMELESVKIRSLKVSGTINSKDIAYLRETTGRFSNLQEIDLSDVTLIADNGEYATLRGANHGIGMGYDQYVFILSDDTRVEESSQSTGLGGGIHTYTYYGNQLAGAFSGLTNLKRIVLPTNLTDVAPYLASGCSNLVAISLPDNYQEIGQGAFGSCSNMASIPTSMLCTKVGKSAFYGSGLSLFDFSNISEIGESAFRTTNIKGVLSLPSIEYIADYAFCDCSGINAVEFGSTLKQIGVISFGGAGITGKITIPEGCEKIGQSAFDGTEITEIEISSSTLNIGQNPFVGTPWYQSAYNSAKVDEIIYLNHIALAFKTDRTTHNADGWSMNLEFREGTATIADGFYNYFFESNYGNSIITSVKFPSTLRWIGDNAFRNILKCTEELTFPEKLEHIGEYAFMDCGAGSLNLDSNIIEIGKSAFSLCDGLVRLYYNVANAGGDWIFYYCKGLESVKFGPEVLSIPDLAFVSCPELVKYEFDNLTLPNIAKTKSLQASSGNRFRIGKEAFRECENLASAVLPSNIESVGDNAFSGTKLKTVYCFAENPVDIDSSDIFSNGKNTTVYVPKESVDIYMEDLAWNKCNIIGVDMGESAIIEISADGISEDSEVRIFNLNGIELFNGKVSDINLPHNIYILQINNQIFKIVI